MTATAVTLKQRGLQIKAHRDGDTGSRRNLTPFLSPCGIFDTGMTHQALIQGYKRNFSHSFESKHFKSVVRKHLLSIHGSVRFGAVS